MRSGFFVLPVLLLASSFAIMFSCGDKDSGNDTKSTDCTQPAALVDAPPPKQGDGGKKAPPSDGGGAETGDCLAKNGGKDGEDGDKDKGTSGSTGDECALTANTTKTDKTNNFGCALLTRDTSSCKASREEQGFTGFWLKFSCNVTLKKEGANVILTSNDLPDTKSVYYNSSDACYEALPSGDRGPNPNLIAQQTITMTVPFEPTAGASTTATSGGVVGMALNGVAIYNNAAAPGDNIYEEEATFDQCDGHPDQSSRYHYHTEPSAISSSDDNFVGILRDGYPVYGRVDHETGQEATGLDSAGGKTSKTVDSPDTAVYHYHVNLQSEGTDSAYFITTGYYKGTPGDCTGCQ